MVVFEEILGHMVVHCRYVFRRFLQIAGFSFKSTGLIIKRDKINVILGREED